MEIFDDIKDRYVEIQDRILSGTRRDDPELLADIAVLNELVISEEKRIISLIKEGFSEEKKLADKDNSFSEEGYRQDLEELKLFIEDSKVETGEFYKTVDIDKLYLYILKAYSFVSASNLDREAVEKLYKMNPDCLKSKSFLYIDSIFEIIARSVVFAETIGITDKSSALALPLDVTGLVNYAVNRYVKSETTFSNEEFRSILDVCSRNIKNANVLQQICCILELREYAKSNNGYLPQSVVSQKNAMIDQEKLDYDMEEMEIARNTILCYCKALEDLLANAASVSDENNKRLTAVIDYMTSLENKLNNQSEFIFEEIPYKHVGKVSAQIMYLNNLNSYISLLQEYCESKRDSDIDLLLLCQENNLVLTDDELKELLAKGIKTVRDNIMYAKRLGIADNIALSCFVKYGSKSVYDRFKALIKTGVLGLDFVESNPIIFNSNAPLGANFAANIGALSVFKINYQRLEDPSILLFDQQTISDSIRILEKNNLQSGLNRANTLKFLASSDLAERCLEITDLGFRSLLDNNLSLLNYDVSRWQRIRLCKELGLTFSSDKEIVKVLDDEEFFVKDEEIATYLAEEKKVYCKNKKESD